MNVSASDPIARETRGGHGVAPAPCRARRPPALVSPDVRRNMIAETAYYRAKRRGFAPGYEIEDWLAAECEVDTALTIGVAPAGD